MIDEQIGLERGLQLFQQAVGHRRAGEAEFLDRAHVARREQRMMNEVVIERRHQIEIGDALGGDQLERVGDVEAAQADESAADERHGKQRAHPHGVIERHDAERALAVGVEILRDMRDRGGALGALAPRHALRPRRGAGGVEHHRPGFGIDARRRVRRRLRTPVRRRRCRRGRPHRARCAAASAPEAESGDRLRGHVLVGDGLGLGVGQIEIEFARGRAPIHRRDDDAGELAGPMQGRGLPAVLQRGDEMIAGLQPDRVEARDQRRNAPVPLRVGQPQLAIDDRQRMRIAGDAGEKA